MPPDIAPQDPSTSPTYTMSTTHIPQQTATGSIRRNLFAAHLSRRPTAPSVQNAFGSPSSTNDRPPQFYTATEAQPVKRNLGFNDIYDHDASPPPPVQPTSLARESIVALHPVTGRPLLPNIPTLPARLRLSDEDEEDDDEEEEEEETSDMETDRQHHHQSHGTTNSHEASYHSGFNHPTTDFDLDQDMDFDSSELDRFNTYHHHQHHHPNRSSTSVRHDVHQFLDSTEESRGDSERIAYLLLEMTSRQRARARTIPTPDPTTSATSRMPATSTTNQPGSTGPSILPSTSSSSTTVSSSSRRCAAAAATTTTGDPSTAGNRSKPHRNQSPPRLDSTTNDPSTLPVGKVIDPLEKDELVSLIMTSLRRKVAVAEDQGWMYGDGDHAGAGLGTVGADGEPFE